MRGLLLVVVLAVGCTPESYFGSSEGPGEIRVHPGELRLVFARGTVGFPLGADGYPRRGWQTEGVEFHDEGALLKGILERHGVEAILKFTPFHHEGQLQRWIRAERNGEVQWTLSTYSDRVTRTYFVRFGTRESSLRTVRSARRALARLPCVEDVSFMYLVPNVVDDRTQETRSSAASFDPREGASRRSR